MEDGENYKQMKIFNRSRLYLNFSPANEITFTYIGIGGRYVSIATDGWSSSSMTKPGYVYR